MSDEFIPSRKADELAGALDALYNAFNSPRSIAYNLARDDIALRLRSMAHECRDIANELRANRGAVAPQKAPVLY